MESLVFSLRATLPVFILIALGYLLGRGGFLPAPFCAGLDRLVFYLALPLLLFRDLAAADIDLLRELPFLLLCAGVTSLIFFSLWFFARRGLVPKDLIGEFVQLSYRSSAAILGTALLRAVYGNVGPASLMILGCVPLFNFYAVLVLSLEGPRAQGQSLRHRLRAAALSTLQNPILWGIALGLLYALMPLPQLPALIDSPLASLAALATPLALLSIGAGFDLAAAKHSSRTATLASVIKLLVLPALFLPLAILLGLRDGKLLAFLIMLGSTASPTCFIMAKGFGHEGSLSRTVVVLTTLFSSLSLTAWIFLARYLGYLA